MSDIEAVIWLFATLVTKHLVFDYFMQGPYQYLNKGTYGHPGGILHAGLAAAGTAYFVFIWGTTLNRPLPYFWPVVFGEFVIHYHIDWLKTNINRWKGWGPSTNEEFWWALGVDQYLHNLTYLGIVAVLTLSRS